MKLWKHILQRCRAALRVLPGVAAACCLSCAGDYSDGGDASSRNITLALRVALTDAAAGLPDIEKMHDLRVVITSEGEDGRPYVEFNRYLTMGERSGVTDYGYTDDDRLMFRIAEAKLPEKKNLHLYLFSNSEPIFKAGSITHPDPENGIYGSVSMGNTEAIEAQEYIHSLESMTYTNELLQQIKDQGIPMSADYSLTVDPGNTGIVDTYVFRAYIVRAASKITFKFTNKRSKHPLFVQNWELHKVADKAYLLPRVDTEANASLVSGYSSWIDWYAKHIEDSNSGLETGDTFHSGELAFSVPDGVSCNDYNGVASNDTYSGITNSDVDGAGGTTVTGLQLPGFEQSGTGSPTYTQVTDGVTYYFPETCYQNGGDHQAYTMTFKTLEYAEGAPDPQAGYTQQVTYDGEGQGVPLDRVTTLFRNTHVRISASFLENREISILASVYNWTELGTFPETLQPEGDAGSQTQP